MKVYFLNLACLCKQFEVQLMTLILYVRWDVRSMDRLVWVCEATEVYSVRSGYSILNG